MNRATGEFGVNDVLATAEQHANKIGCDLAAAAGHLTAVTKRH